MRRLLLATLSAGILFFGTVGVASADAVKTPSREACEVICMDFPPR